MERRLGIEVDDPESARRWSRAYPDAVLAIEAHPYTRSRSSSVRYPTEWTGLLAHQCENGPADHAGGSEVMHMQLGWRSGR